MYWGGAQRNRLGWDLKLAVRNLSSTVGRDSNGQSQGENDALDGDHFEGCINVDRG